MNVSTREITTLVEATHEGETDLRGWLDGLVTSAGTVLSGAARIVAAIVQRSPTHWRLVAGDSASHAHGPLASFGELLPQIPPAALDAYYRRPERLATHADIAARDPVARGVGESLLQSLGVTDSVALIAQAGEGVSMVLFAVSERRVVLAPREQLLLSRASAHVESALRTRLGRTDPVAVVSPGGKVLHARGSARARTTREALCEHVRRVERGRTRAVRHDADEATLAWTALVSGRFGLLEHARRGTREYHVVPHPEHVWTGRALTSLEARVLELSARGLDGKLVAYSLGVSETTVSLALARAAAKLGCGTRNELIALAAEVLRADGDREEIAGLTRAEQEVLQALRKGWTNAAIARERGSSERTVANQVRAILGKTGRPSRRALVTLPDAGTATKR